MAIISRLRSRDPGVQEFRALGVQATRQGAGGHEASLVFRRSPVTVVTSAGRLLAPGLWAGCCPLSPGDCRCCRRWPGAAGGGQELQEVLAGRVVAAGADWRV